MSDTAKVKLYHHSGALIEFPLPSDPYEASYKLAALYDAGFGVTHDRTRNIMLGTVQIAYVMRGQAPDKRTGEMTDRIWCYAEWGKDDFGSQMTIYLNFPEDVAAFEQAANISVESIPLHRGKKGAEKTSRDFEELARPVNFQVMRRKVWKKDALPDDKGRWIPLGYVGGAKFAYELSEDESDDSPQTQKPTPQTQKPTPPAPMPTPPDEPPLPLPDDSGDDNEGANMPPFPKWWVDLVNLCDQHLGVYAHHEVLEMLGLQDSAGVNLLCPTLEEAKAKIQAYIAKERIPVKIWEGVTRNVKVKGEDKRIIELKTGFGILTEWSRKPFILAGYITEEHWKTVGKIGMSEITPIVTTIKKTGESEDGKTTYWGHDEIHTFVPPLSDIPF